MVGKYTNLADAYLSVIKSLQHACLAANRKLDILWVEASHLEPQTEQDDPPAFKVLRCLCRLTLRPAIPLSVSLPVSSDFGEVTCISLPGRGQSGRRNRRVGCLGNLSL
jgi:hypothetical protein